MFLKLLLLERLYQFIATMNAYTDVKKSNYFEICLLFAKFVILT